MRLNGNFHGGTAIQMHPPPEAMLVRKKKIIMPGEIVGREERGGCTLPDAAKGSTVLLASPFLSRLRGPMNWAYHETVFE